MFSFFQIVEPGLVYANRLSFRANPESLPADPSNAACPVAGEWLTLENNQLVRPVNNAGVLNVSGDTATAVTISFPVIVDKGRTDTQSSAVAGVGTTDGPGAKFTVLAAKGAVCTTSVFALEDNGGVLTYVAGDDLVLGLFLDADGNTRCGLVQSGATIMGAPAEEGDLISIDAGATVVAKVVRAPYSVTGHGQNAGFGWPGSYTTHGTPRLRQVMDIQIL